MEDQRGKTLLGGRSAARGQRSYRCIIEADAQEAREIVACIMGKILRNQYEISKDEFIAECVAPPPGG